MECFLFVRFCFKAVEVLKLRVSVCVEFFESNVKLFCKVVILTHAPSCKCEKSSCSSSYQIFSIVFFFIFC